jgi:glucose-1-phosphate cytidylyltransferase
MKAVILAGGLGTRMGEETASRPKPLVEVGGRPIIWHILKIYEAHGITDFVVCAGYAGHMLTEYFGRDHGEKWRVQVVDTGPTTPTGGRLRRARAAIGAGTFCMTYGDGVSNVDIGDLVAFHRRSGALATVTAVQAQLPFGVVTFPDNGGGSVGFAEKPRVPDLWVNSGFFVMEPEALDAIQGDDEAWEGAPLTRLSAAGRLTGYKHHGFWQCMDAPRDRDLLEAAWRNGSAQWKVW